MCVYSYSTSFFYIFFHYYFILFFFFSLFRFYLSLAVSLSVVHSYNLCHIVFSFFFCWFALLCISDRIGLFAFYVFFFFFCKTTSKSGIWKTLNANEKKRKKIFLFILVFRSCFVVCVIIIIKKKKFRLPISIHFSKI